MASNEAVHDLFDILEEDQDELKYTTKELNRYFEQGHLHSMMDEEDLVEDDSSDIQSMEEGEEEVLSQNFSQLSTNNEDEPESTLNMKKRQTSTASHPDSVAKKVKLSDDQEMDDGHSEQESTPAYLLPKNQMFHRLVEKVNQAASSIDLEGLRQIAILKHQIGALQISKHISLIYLRSGKGELKEPEPEITPVDRRVWPTQVKSAMLAAKPATYEGDEHLICVNLVHQRIQQTEEKIQRCQRQVEEAKQCLFGLTPAMDEAIESFVQEHGIRPLEMKRDLKIALLGHDYDAKIIERQYARENPNEYQIQVAKRLYETKYELERFKREVIELKMRVFFDKPPVSFDAIEGKKMDTMVIHIARAEARFSQCQKAFHVEWKKMWENHRNLVSNKGMSTSLHHLIERRLKNITDKLRDIYSYRINYYLRCSYADEKPTTGFTPTRMAMHTKYRFNDRQQRLLNRGPTYVPPGQMHTSSSYSSIDAMVKKLYAPLQHRLASFFSKYHVNIALSMELEKQTSEQFQDLFMISIPSTLRHRAVYEKELVQSIRHSITKNSLVLRRTADQMNTFYVGDASTFEGKADDFLTTTDAYKALLTVEGDSNEFNEMIDSINSALGILKRRKALDHETADRLRLDPAKVQLPYLYFLPDISKEGEISLMPVIPSQHSATWKIGQYLNRLLHPFVARISKSRSFVDEADLIQKLNAYAVTQHRLRANTLFCTLKITNFHTMASHTSMLETMGYFLQDNLATPKLEHLSTATIQNLLQLFLYNNIFCYKNTIYTIIRGGPNTVPLSDTLSNMYLFEWQQIIGKAVERNDEIFGRCRDQIFFTWNGSKETLRAYLQTITAQHPHVHLQILMGSSVRFLNAYIENQNGQLYTRVFHDPSMQGYTLPYVSGHAKWNHSDWLRSALIRAVCCCSSVDDFQQERIYLELTFLTSGYSLLFVESHAQHFFGYFHAETMRYSSDRTAYTSFRRQIFEFLDQQRQRCHQLQKLDDQGRLIRFEYLYEFGPRSQFNERFHQLWSTHFSRHPMLSNEQSKIILTTKHRHSLNALLTQPKSFCWIKQ